MRLIVLSDSHFATHKVREIVAAHKDTAHLFIHLGDGIGDLQEARRLWPQLSFVCVRGNNDPKGQEPRTLVMHQGGYRLLLTHGDLFGVKYSMDGLESAARAEEAEIALYGHTHVAAIQRRRGLYLINPGSVVPNLYGKASYLCLDFLSTGIVPTVESL